MSVSPEDPLNPGIEDLEQTSGSSERRGSRKPQLYGVLVGFCLGASLLVWAIAVDVVRFGGSGQGDICDSPDSECALIEGLSEVGANISSEIEGMVLTGVFLATVIFVGLGIWLCGMVGRRRSVRMTVQIRQLPTVS